MNRVFIIKTLLLLLYCIPGCSDSTNNPEETNQEPSTLTNSIKWGEQVTVNNSPGTFGSEYGRMFQLKNGDWLAVYTILRNDGYKQDPDGGRELQISRSRDNGETWIEVATITDPGRDLDNGQMIQFNDGTILLAARSVRWQESYHLPVYKSTDNGHTWTYLSTIDFNEGTPGSLGNPDKGVYEPHFGFLADGRLAVMYANETHVTESPSYSQIISQKISADNGATWGDEIWVAAQQGAARPGMPVWTRMENGQYIVVFEICGGTQDCNVFYKISEDGITWSDGIGTQIPDQLGGPYILSLADGRLLVTSNSSNMSFSDDFGTSWKLAEGAWQKIWPHIRWPSLYQTGINEVCAMNSVSRDEGGNNIQIRFGILAD